MPCKDECILEIRVHWLDLVPFSWNVIRFEREMAVAAGHKAKEPTILRWASTKGNSSRPNRSSSKLHSWRMWEVGVWVVWWLVWATQRIKKKSHVCVCVYIFHRFRICDKQNYAKFIQSTKRVHKRNGGHRTHHDVADIVFYVATTRIHFDFEMKFDCLPPCL